MTTDHREGTPAEPETAFEATLRESVPLAPLTTLGIGGPARFYARVSSLDRLQEALRWAARRELPLFILGGGSNLLVADAGFPGLVVHVDLRGIDFLPDGDDVVVRGAAGESWDRLVEAAVEAGLQGIESLSGIPGLVGATPIQNVGAYGQEVSETIVEVEVFDREAEKVRRLTNEACCFAYRASRFKRADRDRFIVLSVSYRLRPGAPPLIRYPELERFLRDHRTPPSLRAVREAVIAIRRRKGMVVDPGDPDSRSAGSFFMNPLLAPGDVPAFFERVAAAGIDAAGVPAFPAGDATKLSAAWLIENSGFSRGFRHRRTGLSTKHTLAIVNYGGATAAEVVELVEMIRGAVSEKFGLLLHPEPNFIGFDR